ncbi:phosphatase [Rhizoctonia solani]|uniref:Phosphatase n=1 Tax=Rhizoctonia solani TaxID=456999 RepID=A0A8H8NV24_9AGAM|nr:phosphatase [Rhizoctonia solani]QRW18863.1 phosphatase [Rhizoctonia solani]
MERAEYAKFGRGQTSLPQSRITYPPPPPPSPTVPNESRKPAYKAIGFFPTTDQPRPPPPIRHPFAAAEISQPRPIPARSRGTVSKLESRSRANSKSDDVRSRSRSRSVDTKRKSQRSYVALDQKGGVGACPAPDSDREHMSIHSDHTFGAPSTHTLGHSIPWSDDSNTISTGGKRSDPPAVVFADHPFRMHTGSPPPRSHTASASLATTTPWVRTITASPAPPDPPPMRKRTLTYQPGLVTAFGSAPETRVGYRESGAFVGLDDREREKIRPTLLPPSLSLLGKDSTDGHEGPAPDEHGQIQKAPVKDRELYPGLRQQYDLRSHPYALQNAPAREIRFGSASTASTATTGASSKPPVPPRPSGMKLKSSLKASMSTPELRIRIPSTVTPSGLSTGQTPSTEHPQSSVGLGARPRHVISSAAGHSVATNTTLEARSICDALIFARPRFRVASHEITPPPSTTAHDEEAAKRASIRVGEGGLKGLVCFPRKTSRDFHKDKGKGKEKEKEKVQPSEPREFQTVEQVLREGAQLEKEREEWNAIGQGSLLNSHARSLSRAQSKIGNGGHRNAKRRETVSGSDTGAGTKVWGTIKIKRSVEMLAASALSRGRLLRCRRLRDGRVAWTQASVSTASHARHASGSVASRGHSRNGSWGQRVVCGSRSGSSMGGETAGTGIGPSAGTGTGQHIGHSSEGLLPKRATVDNYPIVDIRPVPAGNTNRARAPPAQGSVGFSFGTSGTRQGAHSSPSKKQKQPLPSPGTTDPESVIGLALSSPSGATTPLMLPNHPFAQRAGAYPTDPAPGPPPGPETIATRHRHPPRSSGSTERARLDDVPKMDMHPFVARMSTHSGEVQRMFESAMLKSAGGQGELAFNTKRGSGDSGLGSSVHEHAGPSSVPLRGSAFGPPAGLETARTLSCSLCSDSGSRSFSVYADGEFVPCLEGDHPYVERDARPVIDVTSIPLSLSLARKFVSSFSSPRPLNSLDDIESLRDIFYRPSPDRVASLVPNSQDGSPANEPVLIEEDEEEAEANDWTFGRRPFELGSESHLIWRRQREDNQVGPLRINLAPGTPSPPPPGTVPESVHDSDSRSERSVRTTSSQQATNENVTFGVVPSARIDSLSVNVVSPRQSAALSLIDMYDYEASFSSSSPNTPQTYQIHPSPYALSDTLPSRESYYTSSSPGLRPGVTTYFLASPTRPWTLLLPPPCPLLCFRLILP